MKMQKFKVGAFFVGAIGAIGCIANDAQASMIYTVTGNYNITYPTSAAGTGTFTFQVSGTYDTSVDTLTVVAPGDPVAPFDFVGGETITSGPTAGTAPYLFNDPALNFQVSFPDAFNGTVQTGGSGTTFANGDYALLSNVSVSVPEPASLAVIGLGGLTLLRRRTRSIVR